MVFLVFPTLWWYNVDFMLPVLRSVYSPWYYCPAELMSLWISSYRRIVQQNSKSHPAVRIYHYVYLYGWQDHNVTINGNGFYNMSDDSWFICNRKVCTQQKLYVLYSVQYYILLQIHIATVCYMYMYMYNVMYIIMHVHVHYRYVHIM